MTDRPTAARLSREEVAALKFAAHRQLARWSHKRELSPRHQAQRTALKGAIRILQDATFANGCELHRALGEENADGD